MQLHKETDSIIQSNENDAEREGQVDNVSKTFSLELSE